MIPVLRLPKLRVLLSARRPPHSACALLWHCEGKAAQGFSKSKCTEVAQLYSVRVLLMQTVIPGTAVVYSSWSLFYMYWFFSVVVVWKAWDSFIRGICIRMTMILCLTQAHDLIMLFVCCLLEQNIQCFIWLQEELVKIKSIEIFGLQYWLLFLCLWYSTTYFRESESTTDVNSCK